MIWGLAATLLALAPGFVLTTLLPQLDNGILGIMGIILTVVVAPLFALAASAGAILLLVAVVRRDPF